MEGQGSRLATNERGVHAVAHYPNGKPPTTEHPNLQPGLGVRDLLPHKKPLSIFWNALLACAACISLEPYAVRYSSLPLGRDNSPPWPLEATEPIHRTGLPSPSTSFEKGISEPVKTRLS